METYDYQVMIDVAAKLHSFLFIEGWFFAPGDKLVDITIENASYGYLKKDFGYNYGGVLKTLGPELGFKLEIVFDDLPPDYFLLEVVFVTRNGKRICHALGELTSRRLELSPSIAIGEAFASELNRIEKSGRVPKVLDIGGRNRSGVDRSLLFPNCDVVVLDILPGDNVDVVGDAHSMGDLFPPGYFDAVYSVSVFEHLLMPWKAVIEMNKVLKNGGVGIVFTHQSLGMHDLPWDFYRFSDTAWDGLFNEYTGFEIINRALDYTQYVIPFVLRPGKIDADKSAGFEGSTVFFRKTCECSLSWDVKTSAIVDTMYPSQTASAARTIVSKVLGIF